MLPQMPFAVKVSSIYLGRSSIASRMKFLNTPEDRFTNIKDYPWSPNYHNLGDGLMMHYLDEGPADANETLLLMHGEPSWSYLYRKMIPGLVAAGYRCIVPDLIGFGKSSKPTETSDYTYAKHITWTNALLDHLNLSNLTLFCQDWGGLIGLRLVTKQPDRFSRIVASNTFLPTGDREPPEAFKKWQAFSQKVETFPFEMVLQGATETELTTEELAAYRAPYPDESYTAGARIFPALVPTTPDDPESANNRKAWAEVLTKWKKPCITLFGDKDPITAGAEKLYHKLIPGTKDQKHQILEGGGHFIQEDKGPELTDLIIQFINDNPST